MITKVCAFVAVSALIDYVLTFFLLRGPIVLLTFMSTFLLKPMVTICFIVLAVKLVISSVEDMLKYDWGLHLEMVPTSWAALLNNCIVLLLLGVALVLYYRYGSSR
jgi:hypothetical protein